MSRRLLQVSVELSPAEAERRIALTRAELALTLDALKRQLAPPRLVEKGFDMLKETIDSNDLFSRGLNRSFEAVRANPIPVALIGVGAVWLIAERTLHQQEVEARRRRVGELAGDRPLGHTGNPLVDRAPPGRPDGWTHQAADLAQGALNSVRDSGQAMVNNASAYAADGVTRVAGQLSGAVQRHPLVAGAVGALAGAFLAIMLPVSRLEDEAIGGTRAQLQRRVRETAVRAAGAAAGAATQTVRAELDKPSQP
ncbi:MAG TPA: DUF3618 domain-containing protein [Stellaceae bacterium]|nr:DUF3618 domain-containing protein [Stellaceae bacterium]